MWQHQFSSFTEARQVLRAWIAWYNAERPHQALDYLSPQQYAQIHAVEPPNPPAQCLRAA